MGFEYKPPADFEDFPPGSATRAGFRTAWHDYIAKHMTGARELNKGLFFAPHETDEPTAGGVVPVPWNGFPQSLTRWFEADTPPRKRQAFEAAEKLEPDPWPEAESNRFGILSFRRRQDEYCEWFVDRNAEGGITRISFTAEAPEYWRFLAEHDLALVGDLYRKYVSPDVRDEDLVFKVDVLVPDYFRRKLNIAKAGTYDPRNIWNTARGAMHLTHGANTLGAEIRLASDGSVLYKSVDPQPAESLVERLICCAGYGGVNRSSDPRIGAAVNQAASTAVSVSLAEPIGLYISDVALDGLRDPERRPIGEKALDIRRKSEDGTRILRAEVRVPEGATYTLDQCTLDGQPLRFGGQIAEKITMSLYALTRSIPGAKATSSKCNYKCCRRGNSNYVDLAELAANCNNHDFDNRAPALESDFDVARAQARFGERVPVPAAGVASAPLYSSRLAATPPWIE